ncbi:hypothetical protein [Haloactinopolyspora sp.]|uniref:hypothetical protein n=1 Tax=Haloactinopolyspora sp. TaxID=1966353 RepID=UPI002631BC7C|nr:hypothetical protein [Haloactinopolyspora sp.]
MEWFAGAALGVIFGLMSPATPWWLTVISFAVLVGLMLVSIVLDAAERRRRRTACNRRPPQHHHVLVLHSDAPYDWAADDTPAKEA